MLTADLALDVGKSGLKIGASDVILEYGIETVTLSRWCSIDVYMGSPDGKPGVSCTITSTPTVINEHASAKKGWYSFSVRLDLCLAELSLGTKLGLCEKLGLSPVASIALLQDLDVVTQVSLGAALGPSWVTLAWFSGEWNPHHLQGLNPERKKIVPKLVAGVAYELLMGLYQAFAVSVRAVLHVPREEKGPTLHMFVNNHKPMRGNTRHTCALHSVLHRALRSICNGSEKEAKTAYGFCHDMARQHPTLVIPHLPTLTFRFKGRALIVGQPEE